MNQNVTDWLALNGKIAGSLLHGGGNAEFRTEGTADMIEAGASLHATRGRVSAYAGVNWNRLERNLASVDDNSDSPTFVPARAGGLQATAGFSFSAF